MARVYEQRLLRIVAALGILVCIICMSYVWDFNPPPRGNKHMETRSNEGNEIRPNSSNGGGYLASLFHNIDFETEERFATKGGPLNYLPEYRNPCWKSRIRVLPNLKYFALKVKDRVRKRRTAQETSHLRCLPSVYLIGAGGSGTTDLYRMLTARTNHQILGGFGKEPLFWGEKSVQSFSEYLDNYEGASKMIKNGYRQSMLLDGSTFNLVDDKDWKDVPGNKGLREPIYTLPKTLKAVYHASKIMVMLREPADRLLSNFRTRRMMFNVSSHHLDAFDSAVRTMVPLWNQCIATSGLRACAYDYRSSLLEKSYEIDILMHNSLYYPWIKEWKEAFGGKQFKIIRAEDYYNDRVTHVNATFNFLGINPLSKASADYIRKAEKAHSHDLDSMLPQTREYLDKFFAPHNAMLAEYLNDDKFLWPNPV